MFRSIINYVKLLLVPTVEKPKAKKVCTNTSVRNRKHFDKSELAMAALQHDLGKLGDPTGEPYYLIEESDWHRKNQNSAYKHNDKLNYVKVTDRALFTLQQYDIQITQKEWLAIKLSDGLYEKGNDSYLAHYGKFPIHTNLPYIIHWADHMATNCERDPLKQEWVESV